MSVEINNLKEDINQLSNTLPSRFDVYLPIGALILLVLGLLFDVPRRLYHFKESVSGQIELSRKENEILFDRQREEIMNAIQKNDHRMQEDYKYLRDKMDRLSDRFRNS